MLKAQYYWYEHIESEQSNASIIDWHQELCRCLTQMGTAKESFIELTERIGRKTGGLSVSPFIADIKGESAPAAFLMLSGKATGDKAQDLLDLFHDILHTAKLDDQARFKQVKSQLLLLTIYISHEAEAPCNISWCYFAMTEKIDLSSLVVSSQVLENSCQDVGFQYCRIICYWSPFPSLWRRKTHLLGRCHWTGNEDFVLLILMGLISWHTEGNWEHGLIIVRTMKAYDFHRTLDREWSADGFGNKGWIGIWRDWSRS